MAIVNLVTCAIAAGVSLQMEWEEWWHPLLVIWASTGIVSSLYLWFVERQYQEGSPERSRIAWTGNILFVVGIGLAIAVLSATGAI